jgi:hypothetical protein
MKNLLYNMTKEQLDLYAMLNDTDGEITPEIELELNKFETNEVGRAFTMKAIIARFEDKAELAKKKKDEMAKIQKACENAVMRGKQYLTDYLLSSGKRSLEYEAETIKLKKNPPAVQVLDENKVPDKYKRFKATLDSRYYEVLKSGCSFLEIEMPEIKIEIDKTKIKNENKNGVEVAGTELKQSYTVTLKG